MSNNNKIEKVTYELKQLRKLAALLQSAWFYGDWKAETLNEHEMEAIMREQGLWPVTLSAHTFEPNLNQYLGDNNVGENNGVNNNPDNMTGENNNTSTTGNISYNIWGGDTSSTTGNINTWSETRTDDDNRAAVEKQIWDKTVNWDKNNTVNDEEQAPYNIKTDVVTSGKKDDGTLATIEITISIKQR